MITQLFLLIVAGASIMTMFFFFLYIILRAIFGKQRRPQIEDIPMSKLHVHGSDIVEVEESL
jgi:hypothetical protein